MNINSPKLTMTSPAYDDFLGLSWTSVATTPERRERFRRALSPYSNGSAWTDEEIDVMILNLVRSVALVRQLAERIRRRQREAEVATPLLGSSIT